MRYFNKLVNLTLQSDSDAFKIVTPKTGIKPNISIHGNLSTKTMLETVEIKISNLYTSKDLTEYKNVIVEAGYESSMAVVINGNITSIFTSSPGPDKETTILCTTANLSAWVEKTVNVSIDAGTTLQSIAEQISSALEFQEPFVSPEIKDNTIKAPIMVNGAARTLVSTLKQLMPTMSVIVNSNKLYFLAEKKETAVTHTVSFLTQAPQYSGVNISICAPWIPNVKPGDLVRFPTSFYSVANDIKQEKVYGELEVVSVSFSFGTRDENEMTITGVAKQ